MRIVFFGTPDYVVPILESLHKNFKSKLNESPIVAVVTQKPMPAGRKQQLEYSPVDTWAHKHNIPTYFDVNDLIDDNITADVGILASYGNLIPENAINYFPHGIIVVHPSLLPEFRWASPIPGALVSGTNPTGVSFIKMDSKWDHGPIITSFKEEVLNEDTYGSLRKRLFERSGDVMIGALPAYLEGKIKPKEQDESKATYARIIKKEDAFIPPKYLKLAISGTESTANWGIDFIQTKGKQYYPEVTPVLLDRFTRAMNPWPMAWTLVSLKPNEEQKRLKIIKVHTEGNKLILDEVQLEGKDPVSWEQFVQGYPSFTLNQS